MKLHVAYDVDAQLASQAVCTHASVPDGHVIDRFEHVKAIFVMDRGHLSFKLLYQNELNSEHCVTRVKHNTNCKIVKPYSKPAVAGVESDSLIKLDNSRRYIDYPRPARLVVYLDPESGKRFRFLTNIWDLSAHEIAEIYKARW